MRAKPLGWWQAGQKLSMLGSKERATGSCVTRRDKPGGSPNRIHSQRAYGIIFLGSLEDKEKMSAVALMLIPEDPTRFVCRERTHPIRIPQSGCRDALPPSITVPNKQVSR
jgi:hypothetical protein